jgi:hypothetical protein
MSAPKLLFTHQAMEPSIPIARDGHMLSKVILLYPINLKIAKRLAIPTTYDWERVLGLQAILDKLFLVRQVTLLTPKVRYARVIHPLV